MQNKKLIITIIVLTIVFLIPISVTCGAPSRTCTPAPDMEGKIYREGDIEPFGVMLIELVTQRDFFLKYSTYTSVETTNSCVTAGKYISTQTPKKNCCNGLIEVPLTLEEKALDGISAKCIIITN